MGLLSLLATQPLYFVIISAIIIAAITIHECAHAWVADKLGDPTPRYQGRVTLNPLAHLDLWGTILLFLVGFGWGKPVIFDPYNLKKPVRDSALIALAGPVSNLLVALLLSVVIPLLIHAFPSAIGMFSAILSAGIFYNCMLAIFNLVPVHPLDGSKIIMAVLPKRTAIEYEQLMARYGLIILFALIIPWSGQSPISFLISPVINLFASFFGWLAGFIAAVV